MERRTVFPGGEGTWQRDSAGVTPTQAVTEAVADFHDCHPTELPPLNEVLDPDALDLLFADDLSGRSRRGGHLVFHYADCTVTVFCTGKIVVYG